MSESTEIAVPDRSLAMDLSRDGGGEFDDHRPGRRFPREPLPRQLGITNDTQPLATMERP